MKTAKCSYGSAPRQCRALSAESRVPSPIQPLRSCCKISHASRFSRSGFEALTIHTPSGGLWLAPLPLPLPLAERLPQPRPDSGLPPPPEIALDRAPMPEVLGQHPPLAAAFGEIPNLLDDPADLARRAPGPPGCHFRPGNNACRNVPCAAVKSVGYCRWVPLVDPPLRVQYEGG